MFNSIGKIKTIDAGKLDSKFFFQSLLEQAVFHGLLSDQDIERLQYECLRFLAYQTERFNAGDSSSIPVEKAQDIMASILYTIGLWLKTFPNPDDAVTALQNESISKLYEKGRKRIDTLLSTTKAIHASLLSQLVDTPNVFYRSTLDEGIKGFFKLYYPDYSAQEIHITADYPLFNPIPDLEGIEFIKAYLKAAYRENLFCKLFSANDIHHLLCGYVENYQEHLINLYEPVLLAALGCCITGTDVYRLDITQAGAASLYRLFADLPKDGIASLIQNTAKELVNILSCSQGLIQYIQTSLPLVISKIELAARKQTLDRVFALPYYPENKPQIILSFGNNMDDGQYRKIIGEITQCRFALDKLAIIKERVQSLADLEDILLDADFNAEETKTVLQALGTVELSALSKKYLPMSEMDPYGLREQEQRLQKRLHDFIAALPKARQELITQAANAIKPE